MPLNQVISTQFPGVIIGHKLNYINEIALCKNI